MPVKPVPDGYHTITPYLTVDDPGALINFLQQAFEAKLGEVTKDDQGNIRHAEVRIGDSMVLTGKARDQWKSRPGTFYLYVPNCDEVYKKALAAGGMSVQELTDHFYGDRSGAVRDSQGNDWWIASHVEDVSAEEIERRMKAAAR
jgi:PhnB protein